MKAAFFKNMDDIVLREITLPAADVNEVRLRVEACAICGTDVRNAVDGKPEYHSFGHEVAGTVIEVGPAVTNLNLGHKVALDSFSACGMCDNCKNARQDLCTNPVSFFRKRYFGFADEMLTPAISGAVYDGISPEVACLAEPLGVAIDMHRSADIFPGSHVFVSGLGPIGLMALRLAKLSGAEKIYACDLSRCRARIETALQFGADEIIEADKTPINSLRFSQPPDRFMVSSPPRTIPPLIGIAAKTAIISYIGIEHGEGANITFDANEFHFKKMELRGSFATPAMCTPLALRMLEKGLINGKQLISHVFTLDDIAEAMRVAAYEFDKAIKVVVVDKQPGDCT